MTNVTIYEQECFGQTHFRAMRDDGGLLFGRHQTDFPSRDEALSAVLAEFRREKLGAVRVCLVPLERQSQRQPYRRVTLHEGEAELCQRDQCRTERAAVETVSRQCAEHGGVEYVPENPEEE